MKFLGHDIGGSNSFKDFQHKEWNLFGKEPIRKDSNILSNQVLIINEKKRRNNCLRYHAKKMARRTKNGNVSEDFMTFESEMKWLKICAVKEVEIRSFKVNKYIGLSVDWKPFVREIKQTILATEACSMNGIAALFDDHPIDQTDPNKLVLPEEFKLAPVPAILVNGSQTERTNARLLRTDILAANLQLTKMLSAIRLILSERVSSLLMLQMTDEKYSNSIIDGFQLFLKKSHDAKSATVFDEMERIARFQQETMQNHEVFPFFYERFLQLSKDAGKKDIDIYEKLLSVDVHRKTLPDRLLPTMEYATSQDLTLPQFLKNAENDDKMQHAKNVKLKSDRGTDKETKSVEKVQEVKEVKPASTKCSCGMAHMMKILCNLCNSYGHKTTDCGLVSANGTAKYCSICDKMNAHKVGNCPDYVSKYKKEKGDEKSKEKGDGKNKKKVRAVTVLSDERPSFFPDETRSDDANQSSDNDESDDDCSDDSSTNSHGIVAQMKKVAQLKKNQEAGSSLEEFTRTLGRSSKGNINMLSSKRPRKNEDDQHSA